MRLPYDSFHLPFLAAIPGLVFGEKEAKERKYQGGTITRAQRPLALVIHIGSHSSTTLSRIPALAAPLPLGDTDKFTLFTAKCKVACL